MAKKGSSKRSVSKWKKKIWFNILAPSEFDKKKIGETPAEKPEQLKDRTIKINLSNLTSERKHRKVTINFQVDKIQGTNAYTKTKGHEIEESYLRRLTRRRRSKIETVQTVKTKNREQVKVKAITITSIKATEKQRKEIGRIMRTSIEQSASKKHSLSLNRKQFLEF